MRSSSRCWTSSSSLSVFLSPICSLSFFCCHTLTPNLFSICLPAFPHHVHPCAILSNCARSHFVSFRVIFSLRFSQHVSPFSPLQSNPFTLFLKFPRPPPRSLPLFPSVYLLLSSSPGLLFPLPPSLFCSPAAHKNSSFLSPEDCSVA